MWRSIAAGGVVGGLSGEAITRMTLPHSHGFGLILAAIWLAVFLLTFVREGRS